MVRIFLISVVLFLLGTLALGQRQQVPGHSAYPAKVEKATAKAIDLRRSPGASTYRTRLREGLRGGVNFAGRYILTGWGCGTGCTYAAVIDGRTGRVYFPDQLKAITVWFGRTDEEFETFDYKKDSRLLILRGTPGPMDEDLDVFDNPKQGTYYYEWMGTRFRLIKFVPEERKKDVN
ncbi:MAG TPA: hypothetical protein PKD26_03200 [Pyrinomonadaceae bacterium]|nr:hypothetical protein [Pyrinomonadaceae bacterium]